MSYSQSSLLVRGGACLGTVSTTTTYPTFANLGDFATTGFADSVFIVPETGLYLVNFQIALLSASLAATVVALRVLKNGSPIVNSYNQVELGTGIGTTFTAGTTDTLSAGSNTFNLEWARLTAGNGIVTGTFSALGFFVTRAG